MTISRRVISGTALFFLLDGGAVFRPRELPLRRRRRWRNEGPLRFGEARPLEAATNDKEKIAQQKAVKKELKGEYAKWVNEDVRWIITDEEFAGGSRA